MRVFLSKLSVICSAKIHSNLQSLTLSFCCFLFCFVGGHPLQSVAHLVSVYANDESII